MPPIEARGNAAPIAIAAVIAALAAAAAAGAMPAGNVLVQGGLAFPWGHFEEGSGEDAGRAEQGFGLGSGYGMPFANGAFAWVTDVSFLINSVSKPAVREALRNSGVYDSTLSYPRWSNIPLMTGVRYRMGETGLCFWQLQAGMDWAKLGPRPGRSSVVESEWDLAFGYALGLGLIVADQFLIGARYLDLGEHRAAGRIRAQAVDVKGEIRADVSMLSIDIGWIF